MEGVRSARLEFRLQSEVRFRQYKLREKSIFQLNVCENKLKMSVNILLISSVLTFCDSITFPHYVKSVYLI